MTYGWTDDGWTRWTKAPKRNLWTEWLKQAQRTDNRVGDFIEDAQGDPHMAEWFELRGRVSEGGLIRYLRFRGAPPEVIAIAPAVWRRYQQWAKERRAIERARRRKRDGDE